MVRAGSGVVREKVWGKRKGFKCDRRTKYLLAKKGIDRNSPKAKQLLHQTETHVKELVFDPEQRKDFVLGFHKRKNERRAVAQFQSRLQVHRKTREERKELREEARVQYNTVMQVPINPDFTLIRNVKRPLVADGVDRSDGSDDGDVHSTSGTEGTGLHVTSDGLVGDQTASKIACVENQHPTNTPGVSCFKFESVQFGQGIVTVQQMNRNGDIDHGKYTDQLRSERERTQRALREHQALLRQIEAKQQEDKDAGKNKRSGVVVQKELARLRRIRSHSRKSKKNKRKQKDKKKGKK